jgi:hypothetical protein
MTPAGNNTFPITLHHPTSSLSPESSTNAPPTCSQELKHAVDGAADGSEKTTLPWEIFGLKASAIGNPAMHDDALARDLRRIDRCYDRMLGDIDELKNTLEAQSQQSRRRPGAFGRKWGRKGCLVEKRARAEIEKEWIEKTERDIERNEKIESKEMDYDSDWS